jgi:hypothetical protein
MLDEIPNLQFFFTRLSNKYRAYAPRVLPANPRTNNDRRSARVPLVHLQIAAIIDASSFSDPLARLYAFSFSISSRTRATSNSLMPKNNLPSTPRFSLFLL